MASVSRPEPCMPMPIMPKRTRSLGTADCAAVVYGCESSRIVLSAFVLLAASRLPAATAPVCRNSRREKSFLFFMWFPSLRSATKFPHSRPEPKVRRLQETLLRFRRRYVLVQRCYRNFLEKDDVVIAVILQPDETKIGARAALRLEIEFARRDRVAVCVVGDLHAVEHHDGTWAVEGDIHDVPLRAGLPGFGERLGQGIQHAGGVVFIFLRGFRVVVDLYFETVVHGHPLLAGLDRDANEYAGIVVFIAHAIDHVNVAVADFTAGPVEEAHAAVGVNQAVGFNRHVAGADVVPTREILAVEELPRVLGIAGAGILRVGRGGGHRRKAGEQAEAHDQTISQMHLSGEA